MRRDTEKPKISRRGAFIVVTNTFLACRWLLSVIYLCFDFAIGRLLMQILYTFTRWLYTTVLVLPIIALSRQVFETLNNEYTSLFQSPVCCAAAYYYPCQRRAHH